MISYFNKYFVAEGIFNKEYSKILIRAERVRNKSDYRDFYVVSRDVAAEQIENAEKFIREMDEFIKRKLINHENRDNITGKGGTRT